MSESVEIGCTLMTTDRKLRDVTIGSDWLTGAIKAAQQCESMNESFLVRLIDDETKVEVFATDILIQGWYIMTPQRWIKIWNWGRQ